MEKEVKPLPGIFEYLNQIDNNIEISTEGLEDLAAKIRSSTGLELESCHILIRLFFQEIQKEMLKGNVVSLNDFGKFMIACPRNQLSKNVSVQFQSSKKLFQTVKENGRK